MLATGIIGFLYILIMATIAILAIYALVLLIIFLRLRIEEIKTARSTGPIT